MKRDAVDFHEVEHGHARINARLENWARWANGRPSAQKQPMFRLYRPDSWYREVAAIGVDPLDAQLVQKGVNRLPEKQRDAVNWHYLSGRNPARAARLLAVSIAGLRDLVHFGRQMLVARGF